MKSPIYLIVFIISWQSFSQELGKGYEFENNGKEKGKPDFNQIYQRVNVEVSITSLSSDAMDAFSHSLKYLEKNLSRQHHIDNLTFSNKDLHQVSAYLSQQNPLDSLSLDSFDLYQIQGEDKKGNVHFTGYFVPVIEVRQTPDAEFKYPLYKKPSLSPDQMPTRNEIDFQNAFKDKNLELAYSSSLLDNYFMQVQGSGVVQFPNGETQLLSYGGKNHHPYVSIGRHLVDSGQIPAELVSMETIRTYFGNNPDSLENILSLNPSYTFFTKGQSQPVGAANVSLTASVSVAVDTNFIPLGATLLAKVPILNEENELTGHEYHLLTAQDRGGAIKGPGHIDLYFGVGLEAERKANAMHHYGKVWLLLPND